MQAEPGGQINDVVWRMYISPAVSQLILCTCGGFVHGFIKMIECQLARYGREHRLNTQQQTLQQISLHNQASAMAFDSQVSTHISVFDSSSWFIFNLHWFGLFVHDAKIEEPFTQSADHFV